MRFEEDVIIAEERNWWKELKERESCKEDVEEKKNGVEKREKSQDSNDACLNNNEFEWDKYGELKIFNTWSLKIVEFSIWERNETS